MSAHRPPTGTRTGRAPDRSTGRLTRHPILPIPSDGPTVDFRFGRRELSARRGEMISSALHAAGIRIFGRHHRDGRPQGIFCVNGQCSQCLVVADGRPVKACMTPVEDGMLVEPVYGRPRLGAHDSLGGFAETRSAERAVQVLVVGGGPAGISAAIELGRAGLDVVLIDDKPVPGGKLSLQTHTFFGSIADCYAGTRGIDIGTLLANQLAALPSVRVWLDTPAVGVFSDKVVGVVHKGRFLRLRPEVLLVAAGAREKVLTFPGCDLPGVYGAGAFQTLVNRDLVRPAKRLFIVGGGNVGLIGAYHALQAGIEVVGLVEALPRCGGYRVHEDKIRRLGVPVWTSHTVLRAEGRQGVRRVVVARCDERFRPVEGTAREFAVDTLLVAVGLAPVNELLAKARSYGMRAYGAGDAEEIAEASAAIFSGRIAGRTIARDLGRKVGVPQRWSRTAAVLRSKPGPDAPDEILELDRPVQPIIRCWQAIPCNPCTQVCPLGSITIPDGSITSRPRFEGDCLGCGRCATICPGLAITLLERDHDPKRRTAVVVLPFEFDDTALPASGRIVTTGSRGEPIGRGRILGIRDRSDQDRRRLVRVEVPWADRLLVAGFRVQKPAEGKPLPTADQLALSPARAKRVEGSKGRPPAADDDPILCLCEGVRRGEVVAAIREGVRDFNQLKASIRCALGGCNGKRCTEPILQVFRQEGVDPKTVARGTYRPLDLEVPLGVFAASVEPEGFRAGEGLSGEGDFAQRTQGDAPFDELWAPPAKDAKGEGKVSRRGAETQRGTKGTTGKEGGKS
ncbi:MAG: FAD-dependent oxidoreductase [Deltaproteobacteria bacterium]|nr:FAD-dependent oxidoreductase [Deltaproteobacteria bacterium]